MRPIKILCLNSAVDHSIDVTEFSLGSVIRSTDSAFYASGKGANTAVALAILDYSVTLYSIVGVKEAELFREMHPRVTVFLEEVEGKTRENVTVVEQGNKLVCHLQTTGPVIGAHTIGNLISKVADSIDSEDVFIVSGSMPRGVEPADFEKLISLIKRNGATLVLDVDPQYWANVDLTTIDLVKPNIEEWGRHVRTPLETIEDAMAIELPVDGPKYVLLSAGSQGAVLLSRDGGRAIRGWTELTDPVLANPIGCGDAMVGGIAVALALGLDLTGLLKFGTALGYANLFAPGPGRVDPDHFVDGMNRFRSDTRL